VWRLLPIQRMLTSFTTSSATPPQKHLFTLGEGLGKAAPVFAWSGRGELLAAAGQPRAVLIFARGGDLLDTLELPGPEFPFSDRLPSARQLQARPQPARFCCLVFASAQPVTHLPARDVQARWRCSAPTVPAATGSPGAGTGVACPQHLGAASLLPQAAVQWCAHLVAAGVEEVQDLFAAHATGRFQRQHPHLPCDTGAQCQVLMPGRVSAARSGPQTSSALQSCRADKPSP